MLERLLKLFGDRLALRIGVNSGEVVVGRPREGSSFATGDAVNVAARLEQAAAPGQVLVGERTAALVGDAFEFGEPSTVEAKGKKDGVVARELRRMVAPRRPRGGQGLVSTFVGRERELDWLQQVSVTDEPRFALVVGEPGLGKTAFVRELRERLPAGTTFRLGRCLSYGRSVTYSPLADVLRQELGLREEDLALEKLAGRRDPRADPGARRRRRPRAACGGARAPGRMGAPRVGHWDSRPGRRRAGGPALGHRATDRAAGPGAVGRDRAGADPRDDTSRAARGSPPARR